jgi:hypothetical protein
VKLKLPAVVGVLLLSILFFLGSHLLAEVQRTREAILGNTEAFYECLRAGNDCKTLGSASARQDAALAEELGGKIQSYRVLLAGAEFATGRGAVSVEVEREHGLFLEEVFGSTRLAEGLRSTPWDLKALDWVRSAQKCN